VVISRPRDPSLDNCIIVRWARALRRSGRDAATGISQFMSHDTLLLVSATILLWGLAALLLI
jgi:hypothetical protein